MLEKKLSIALPPRELEAVYAISSAVAQSLDVQKALDEIIRLTRPVFIFDNIVLYFKKDGAWLEPLYARIIGRGKTSDGDVAWGETIANEVYRTNKTLIRQEKLPDWETNRLSFRIILGLPIPSSEGIMGALVFGRFGGPVFTPEQVHLSEFVALHIGQLLIRQQLGERVANLEAEKRLQFLQENFIAMVSHELCTPLGFIKGYATSLLREDANWDEATRREFLSVIDEEADRLRELIDNLLDSSRLQTGTLRMQMQVIRLDELVQETCIKAATHYAGMKIDFSCKKPVKVLADPMRITQVCDNLISNVVKYAPGSVLKVNVEKIKKLVMVSFSDQGPGISPEHIPNLFQRFYRAQSESTPVHGTGLGLYICQEIVRAHKGEIVVTSKLGEGTTFTIQLPVAD
jgi:signal transduction histidine kinase